MATALDKSKQLDMAGLAIKTKDIDASGDVTVAGTLAVTGATTQTGAFGAGAITSTSASATALTVGRLGATTPAFTVDASTASQVAGLKVVGAATAGTVAVVVTDSGTNASLTVNAKGTGTIGIGSVSTGAVTITPATTITGALTPSGGIAAAGGFSNSARGIHTGGMSVTQTTDGNDTTPATTEVYIAEVRVSANCTITGVAVFNGSAVGTDKLIVSLYDSTGALLANSALAGTTATGTDAFQLVAFTGTYAAKGPATYYVGVSCNGTTYRLNTHILGAFGASKKTGEVFGTLTAITPPTTFTTAVGPIASLY